MILRGASARLLMLAWSCAEPPSPVPVTPSATAAAPIATEPVAAALPTTAPLFPPATPGASRTELEGCLAAGAGDATDGARFPARAASRGGASDPEVTISKTGTGVVVTHALGHACCLKASVAASVEAGALSIDETLSGDPCRCECRSSIRTAVGLAPGKYTVSVRLHDPGGGAREVHRDELEIRRLRAE